MELTVMGSFSNKIGIDQAAKSLGRELCGKAPHVVGTSLRRRDPDSLQLDLFVDIDSPEAKQNIPTTFHGYNVYTRLVGTPQFA